MADANTHFPLSILWLTQKEHSITSQFRLILEVSKLFLLLFFLSEEKRERKSLNYIFSSLPFGMTARPIISCYGGWENVLICWNTWWFGQRKQHNEGTPVREKKINKEKKHLDNKTTSDKVPVEQVYTHLYSKFYTNNYCWIALYSGHSRCFYSFSYFIKYT